MDQVQLPSYTTGAQRAALATYRDALAPRRTSVTGFAKRESALEVKLRVQPGPDENPRTLPYYVTVRLGARGAFRVLEDNSPEERERQREIARARRERAREMADVTPSLVIGPDGGYMRLRP